MGKEKGKKGKEKKEKRIGEILKVKRSKSEIDLPFTFLLIFCTNTAGRCRIKMIPAMRLPRPGTRTKILLGLCIAIAVVVALFDWNWLRGPTSRAG